MHGSYIPPQHELGDANTIGGYAAVHKRPAAFEGEDGISYSVEMMADTTGDATKPHGAFFLFMKWNETADPVVTGHIETGFLEFGESPAEALAKLGSRSLAEVKVILDRMINGRRDSNATRPWWEAMRDEDGR